MSVDAGVVKAARDAMGAQFDDWADMTAPRTVTCKVVEARGLLAMDLNGLSDPYCKVSVGTRLERSSVKWNTLEPKWDESFDFHIDDTEQYLIVEVWDRDQVQDDFLGRVMLPIPCLPVGSAEPQWYPLGRSRRKYSVSGELCVAAWINVRDPRHDMNDSELRSLCRRKHLNVMVQTNQGPIEMPGAHERVELCVDEVLIDIGGRRLMGRVYVTNFRLLVASDESICAAKAASARPVSTIGVGANGPAPDVNLDTVHSIPFGSIMDIERRTDFIVGRLSTGETTRREARSLNVRCSDFRTVRLIFASTDKEYEVLRKRVKFHVCNARYHPITHAVVRSNPHLASVGWNVYSIDAEVQRMRVPEDFFKVSDINADYSFSPTYPARFVVPVGLPEDVLVDSASFRSKGRLPVLCWYNARRGNCMVRCAQPRTGTTGKFSVGDERVIERYRLSTAAPVSRSANPTPPLTPSTSALNLIQGLTAATEKEQAAAAPSTATVAPGSGGSAASSLTPAVQTGPMSGQLVIFDARSMIASAGNRLKGKGTEDTAHRYARCKMLFLDIANIHAMRESYDMLVTACANGTDANWLSVVENTQWIQHLKSLLSAASLIARYLDEKGCSVVIHCSDGWDRTSQLVALAQLLLDPYYRTLRGFPVLIEKEWLSFGHKFRDRFGCHEMPGDRSPIFLQFLDCCWQILGQFPQAFEFNADYLLTIAEYCDSGWFGTFLYNNEKERNDRHVSDTSISLWALLEANADSFTNKNYDSSPKMLVPIWSLKKLRLWSEYFLRYDDMHYAARASLEDADDQLSIQQADDPAAVSVVMWVPDHLAAACYDCLMKFTQLRRRHHCRACGQVFCSECVKQRLALPHLGYASEEKVCDSCFRKLKGTGAPAQKSRTDAEGTPAT